MLHEVEDFNEYFREYEESGELPEETILGETFHVIPKSGWQKIVEDLEEEEDIDTGINFETNTGAAHPNYFTDENSGFVTISLDQESDERRYTGIHEETHIATMQNNESIDIYNTEAVAHARDNYFRMKDGKDPDDRGFAPFTNRLITQWTESYSTVADEIGDLEALELVRESFKYEPSTFEKVKMPLSNPYIARFEDLANQA